MANAPFQDRRSLRLGNRLRRWLLEGRAAPTGQSEQHKDHWWRVMCLTGVDYFSSMGFQPGISFLVAGLLSPLATLNLIFLNLFGALPAYWIVAKLSPHGQGSFAIFEKMLHGWRGKTIVLILLGFAGTDFIFTITMCAADATAHLVHNPWMQHPWVPAFLHNQVIVTVLLIVLLAAVFLKGFDEAITISFWLVAGYLAVNFITLWVCVEKLLVNPELVQAWISRSYVEYGSLPNMFAVAFLAFPQLALGMSGFETGVAVMPLVRTREGCNDDQADRIAKARLMLVTLAGIMSIFLLAGSIVTTVLVAPALFQEGGVANGRALAYLTHLYLGDNFGAAYDLFTILILWFAGASGMAALLSLVPQYLPRYGMAPTWAAARRPLVLVFAAVAIYITLIFNANVDNQAPAFATGLLVMLTSAAIAVTLTVWRERTWKRVPFTLISAVFVYSSFMVMREQPHGLIVAMFFIAATVLSSLASRAMRSTELRIGKVTLDEAAQSIIDAATVHHWQEVRFLAHRPGTADYEARENLARKMHSISHHEGSFIFLEITPTDVSEFADDELLVTGEKVDCFNVLRCSSPSVPNAIAALLLYIRDQSGHVPHAYFEWTEGHPIAYVFRYILFGQGETAPLTREILRKAEPARDCRPIIHTA